MEHDEKLKIQMTSEFSKLLWNSANILTLGIFGLAFAVYGVAFASSNRADIFKLVEAQYHWIFVFAVIGNGLIIYGLIAIKGMHQKILQKHLSDESLLELISRSIRFRIIAVIANFAMYITIVALIAFK